MSRCGRARKVHELRRESGSMPRDFSYRDLNGELPEDLLVRGNTAR
jgi:hypothetical protein